MLLVAQPHHDDHTTDYGLAGLVTRSIGDGYKAYYVRGSNDEKDGSHGYARNDMIRAREGPKLRHLNSGPRQPYAALNLRYINIIQKVCPPD